MAPALARTHGCEIDGLDGLVDFRGRGSAGGRAERGARGARVGLVVGVAEARAPVGEVGGDHEGVFGGGEVRGEEGAEGAFGRGGGAAD